jgi:hypothetical protein
MSTAIYEAKATGMAIKNDELRQAFALDDVRCFLLKRLENSSTWTQVAYLTSGYRVRFDDNRSESGLFRYATTDVDFRDDWIEATHVAYGVPDGNGYMEVYAFLPEEKDSIDPDGTSVYWSGRIVKVKNERYAE